MKKKVLSVRIPENTHTAIKNYCKHNNVTVSEYVGQSFTNVGQTNLFDVDVPIDQDLTKYLTSIAGGSLAGVLAYKGVNKVLTEKYPEWSKDKVEMTSVISAMATAMAIGYGVTKLFELMMQSNND